MIQRASSSRWNPKRSLSMLGSMLRGRNKRLSRRQSAPTIGVAVERLEDRTLLDASAPEILMPVGDTADPTPTFEWSSGSDVERYDLMVRNLDNGDKPIRESALTETSFTPATDLVDGAYRVYIRAFHTDGTKSDWDSASFSIDGTAVDAGQTDPQMQAPTGPTADTTPTFQWSTGSDVERYDLMVKNLDTGERLIRESNLSDTSFTPATELPEGNYRAYIRAFKTDGSKSDWDSLAFSIDEAADTSVDIDMTFTDEPMLLTPDGSTDDATPTFNWTAAENVERYDLMVKNLDTGERLIRESDLASTVFTPSSDLPVGNYRAYVRAFFTDGTKSGWDSLSFAIDGDAQAAAMQAALVGFHGADLTGKDGAMASLGFDLGYLYQEFMASDEGSFSPSNNLLMIDTNRVIVEVIAEQQQDVPALQDALEALGMEVNATLDTRIEGWMPIQSLEDLAHLEGVRMVLTGYRPFVQVGDVTSQGDPAMGSDVARATFGIDGTGISVGVLSDTYDALGGAAADIASLDLPPNVTVLQDLANGTDEGRAMLQIVHDVAPGADLLFATAFTGQTGFAQNILNLEAAGSDVIVDDIIFFAEPMFQDGFIAQAVDTVVAAGSSYFSAAGNNATESYESAFTDSGITGPNGTGILHDFDPTAAVDTLQQMTVGVFSQVSFSFQWDQPFGSLGGAGSASDLDIFVTDTLGNRLSGGFSSNLGGDAVEVFTFFNNGTTDVDGLPGADTTFNVQIELVGGPAPGLMKYVQFRNGTVSIDQFDTASSTLYGHANAAGASAVGASAYFNTPAFGTDPPLLNDFSSAGPTPILFDTAGNAQAPEIRMHPNITGPDGVNTTFFGSDIEGDGFPNFFGTSAAAPHAAAVAALMLEAAGGSDSLLPTDIYTAMESTAIDIVERLTPGGGTAPIGVGYDFFSGFGFIDAVAAVEAVGGPLLPQIEISDDLVVEGDAGTTMLVFDVSLSFASDETVMVDFDAFDGTAQDETGDNDYLSIAADTLMFMPGDPLTQQIMITVNGDDKVEPDEFLQVALSNAVNAAIADGMGIGRIVNDDDVSISVKDAVVVEGDAGPLGFTEPATTFDVGNLPMDVLAVDRNGDGLADLVATGTDVLFTDLINQGGLAFNRADAVQPPGTSRAASGDFDNDGVQDLAFTSSVADQVIVVFANPDGTIREQQVIEGVSSPFDIVAANLNPGTPNVLDLVVTNPDDDTITVLRNDGFGLFTAETAQMAGTDPRYLAVANVDDANGDDIIVSNFGSNDISIFRSNNIGILVADASPVDLPDVPPDRSPAGIVAGDFNGDGFDDFAVTENAEDSVSIFLNDGTGGFPELMHDRVAVGARPQDIITADFDVDGDLDLAVANNTSNTVSILENDGTGTFTEVDVLTLDAGAGPFSLAAADLDGDGDLELITADNLLGQVSIFNNEVGPKVAVFTVFLSDFVDVPVSVDFATSDITAVAGMDYVETSGTLQFAPRERIREFVVPIIGDVTDEVALTEFFSVSLSNAINGMVTGDLADSTAIGTIVDDDDVEVVAIVNSVTKLEGNVGDPPVTHDFVVELSQAPAANVEVEVMTVDDTAVDGDDYDAVALMTLTFLAGSTTPQTVSVDIIENDVIGNPVSDTPRDRNFFLELSSTDVTVVQPTAGGAQGMILDDDAGQIHGVKYNDLNANGFRDGMLLIDDSITVMQAAIGDDVVLENNNDDSATRNLGFTFDYYGQSFNSVIINNNGNVSFGSAIPMFDENGFPTSTAVRSIAPFWADVDTTGGNGEVRFTSGISARNQPFVQIDWIDVGYFDGNSDLLNSFTLYIEEDPTGDIVSFIYGDLAWTTGDNEGVGGFGGQGAQLGFDAGDGVNFATFGRPNAPEDLAAFTNQSFVFRLDENGVPITTIEPGLEDVTIYFDDNDNGVLDPGEAFTLTMSDDLNTPQDEGGMFWFVDLEPGDYEVREVIPPLDGFIQITPELGGNGSFEVTVDPGEIVVNEPGFLEFGNAEFTPPELTVSDFTMFEGDVGLTPFEFTFTLSEPAIIPIIIEYTTMDGSATLLDNDYIAQADTITFQPGETEATITVSVVGDRNIEPNETFTVVVTDAPTANVVDGTGVGLILDDDTPDFAISDPQVVEGDVGNALSFDRADFATPSGANDLAAADLNGDGLQDLVVANASPFLASILGNLGGGGFGVSQTFPGTGTASVVTGDFNRDGTQDTAFTDPVNDQVIVSFVRANSSVDTIVVPVGTGPDGLAVADLNFDGFLDLVTANSTAGTVSVLLNDKLEGFATTDFATGGLSPMDVALGDFDGNNAIDIAVSNNASDTVSILSNNGLGVFALTSTIAVGSSPKGLAVADLNGDDADDLAVTNSGDDTISVLLNDGTGTLSLDSTLVTGTAPVDIVAVDFDIDGDIDLATANSGSDDVSLYHNNGTGAFLPLGRPFVGDNPQSIIAVDVDNDGDPDLVTANLDSGDVTVLTNNVDPTVLVFTVTAFNDSNSVASVGFSTRDFSATGGLDFVETSGTISLFPQGVDAFVFRQIVVPVIPDVIPEGFGEFLSVDLVDPINATTSVPSALGLILDDDDVFAGQTISGTKFVDENANGIRDAELFSDEPGLVFVIDVSGTTSTKFNPFLAPGLGDINDDLFPDTVLDAQLSSLINLNEELIEVGAGAITEISIVVFGASADRLDMNPALAGVQLTANPLADADGDGLLDVEQVLRSIKVGQNDTDPNFSNFEAALDETISVLTDLGTAAGDGQVIFMSDGDVNGGGPYTDEVAAIDALGVDITAFAMGLNSSVDDLLPIDPDAQKITQLGMVEPILINQLATFIEPGFPGVTIFLDTDGDGILDADEVSVLTQEDDPSTPEIDETGFYSFSVDPGTYTVAEVVPAGFVQTAPASGTFEVTLDFNDMVTGLDFGNAPLTPTPTVGIGITNSTVIEGDDGAKMLSFTVSLSEASPNTVEVSYTTVAGTATAGSDYTAAAGTLSFAPGVTTMTIEIETFGDLITEVNEVLFVDLSAATGGGVITDGRGIGTIIDDEASVSLQDDPRLLGKTALFIAGTDDADTIELTSAIGGQVQVVVDGENLGLYRPDETIYIITKDGDDSVTIDRLITYDAWVFAGAGDDFVEGGSGNDLIIGDTGDDDINGGFDGRDLLIGGQGLDNIETSSTDNFSPLNNSNVAISGSTIFDDNFDALSVLFDKWNADESFDDRVADITMGDGPVLDDTTVFDEGSVDTLFSYLAGDEDLLLFGAEDSVTVI